MTFFTSIRLNLLYYWDLLTGWMRPRRLELGDLS